VFSSLSNRHADHRALSRKNCQWRGKNNSS